MRGILTGLAVWLGAMGAAHAQSTVASGGWFQEGRGLRTTLFPPQGGTPWLWVGVDQAKREPGKIGFIHVRLTPVLALRGVRLEMDLAQTSASEVQRWVQSLDHANGMRTQMFGVRLVLRRGDNALWECSADDVTVQDESTLVFHNAIVREGPSSTMTGAIATLALDPQGRALHAELNGRPLGRADWDFSLSDSQAKKIKP